MIICLEGNRKCGTKLSSKRAPVQAKREPIEQRPLGQIKNDESQPKLTQLNLKEKNYTLQRSYTKMMGRNYHHTDDIYKLPFLVTYTDQSLSLNPLKRTKHFPQ